MANLPFIYIPPSNTALPGGIPTANTIEYFEKGIDEQGPYYNVQYYINNWSDSDTFINALLGYTHASGQATGGVTKASPHAYPLSPNLLCRRARCLAPGSAILGTSGLPNFNGGALIQAEYRPPLWQGYTNNIQEQIDPTTPIPFCTQRIKYYNNVYTLNANQASNQLFYTTGGSTQQPFRLLVPEAEMSLTFHLSPNLFVFMNGIRAMRGHVNSTTFLGAAPECVYFKDGGTVRSFDSLGNVVQEIEMVFVERDPNQTWNMLPDDANPTSLPWKKVAGGGISGPSPYPTIDFNQFVFGY